MGKTYYASSEKMAKLDELAVSAGLEIRQMMELAGWHMLNTFDTASIKPISSVAIFVGKGNKGGDGLSAARHLINHGYNVDVFMLEPEISVDSHHHLKLLEKMDAKIQKFTNQSLGGYDVVIDSLIGYRLNGSPRGVYPGAVKQINSTNAVVISYDLPTGIIASDGSTPGEVIKADYTLMLALAKQAVSIPKSRQLMGKIVVADIGIPSYLYDQIKQNSRPDFASNGLIEI